MRVDRNSLWLSRLRGESDKFVFFVIMLYKQSVATVSDENNGGEAHEDIREENHRDFHYEKK